jgi:Na+-translocating ferredoxin:NAD+ oxidoreductase subunit B
MLRWSLLTGLLGAGGAAVARALRLGKVAPECAAAGTCPSAAQCGGAPGRCVRVGDVPMVWQLDPNKCTQCGRCATECVLNPSAVKCVHSFSMCGYCKLCFGYFQPGADALTSDAENQLCPTGAIRRKFVEDPYFEYTIDESLCIGCAKCVKGCGAFGNGSLHLQVRHDRCVHCNDCSIARACPANAFLRVPATQAYILKGRA